MPAQTAALMPAARAFAARTNSVQSVRVVSGVAQRGAVGMRAVVLLVVVWCVARGFITATPPARAMPHEMLPDDMMCLRQRRYVYASGTQRASAEQRKMMRAERRDAAPRRAAGDCLFCCLRRSACAMFELLRKRSLLLLRDALRIL